jgi:dihydroflavonol-4-reductase
MNTLAMVTGANGHLGNTLVRALLAQGQRVRAGVRDLAHTAPLDGLTCERVQAELRDPASLRKALHGVDVLYQVAAVFKHWARDPEREIVEVNVQGTRNVLRAAAEAGVKRVVYVSSVAAVGHNGQPLDEGHWNSDLQNPYYRSKILAEQAAWQCAEQLGLPLVTVLPSAMIGPHAARLTDTLGFLASVLARRVPLDPNFLFNFVDVRDVAAGMISAAERGRPGERYLLANRQCSSLAEIILALNQVVPGYRVPRRAPKGLLLALAWIDEQRARFSGRPAELLLSQVRMFYGVPQEYCIDKAINELGYQPRPPQLALQQAFAYLQQR